MIERLLRIVFFRFFQSQKPKIINETKLKYLQKKNKNMRVALPQKIVQNMQKLPIIIIIYVRFLSLSPDIRDKAR